MLARSASAPQAAPATSARAGTTAGESMPRPGARDAAQESARLFASPAPEYAKPA
jgi:hypothetical protein